MENHPWSASDKDELLLRNGRLAESLKRLIERHEHDLIYISGFTKQEAAETLKPYRVALTDGNT